MNHPGSTRQTVILWCVPPDRLSSVCSVPRPMAYCFSAEHAKVIHLVRHGQGVHNVEAAVSGAVGEDEFGCCATLDRSQCLVSSQAISRAPLSRPRSSLGPPRIKNSEFKSVAGGPRCRWQPRTQEVCVRSPPAPAVFTLSASLRTPFATLSPQGTYGC